MIISQRKEALPICESFVFDQLGYVFDRIDQRYLRRLQEAAAAAAAGAHPNGRDDGDASASPTSSPIAQHSLSPSNIQRNSPASLSESSLNHFSSIPPVPITRSRYSVTADTYRVNYYPVNSLSSQSFSDTRSSEPSTTVKVATQTSPKNERSSSYPSPAESYTHSHHGWPYKQTQASPMPPPTPVPPLSYYCRPRRLEEIAPRDTFTLIIALFFDFVYPLTPIIHKPSFMADLHARREERDPLFFALVMSTVASTLVQMPRSYLPMERPVVRKLAQVCKCVSSAPKRKRKRNLTHFSGKTCYEASRHITVASYEPPTSVHVVIRYLSVPIPSFWVSSLTFYQ